MSFRRRSATGAVSVVAALAISLMGCQAAATSTPGPTLPPAASSSVATQTAGAPVGSSEPASAPPSAEAGAAVGTAPPITAWSPLELYLLAGVADGIRPTCVPAVGISNGALAGLECHPAGVGSMGFYAFPNRKSLHDLYVKRLAQFGVAEHSGNGCEDGKPGEGDDTPGAVENIRIGCYIDRDGHANARMAIPNETEFDGVSVYVGVVGLDGSIEHLFATLFPDHQPGGVGTLWGVYQWAPPEELNG